MKTLNKRISFLKDIVELLEHPKKESLALSRADTHKKGVFSLVIDGTEFGKLTRVYSVAETIVPYDVQLHTHRYPITLTTIKGCIQHHTATKVFNEDAGTVQLSEFEYRSPLNQGNGLTYIQETSVRLQDYFLPVCSTVHLTEHDLHTISCSKGAMWMIQEGGFRTAFNSVLGVPFQTANLYKEPSPATIEQHRVRVLKEIQGLLALYKK